MKQFNKKFKNKVFPVKEDLANFFNIFQNKDGNYYFNLNRTVQFNGLNNIAPSLYISYTIKNGDSWTGISYKHYGTIEYWWLICKFNEIYDPSELPKPGIVIKIPIDSIKDQISNQIKNF